MPRWILSHSRGISRILVKIKKGEIVVPSFQNSHCWVFRYKPTLVCLNFLNNLYTFVNHLSSVFSCLSLSWLSSRHNSLNTEKNPKSVCIYSFFSFCNFSEIFHHHSVVIFESNNSNISFLQLVTRYDCSFLPSPIFPFVSVSWRNLYVFFSWAAYHTFSNFPNQLSLYGCAACLLLVFSLQSLPSNSLLSLDWCVLPGQRRKCIERLINKYSNTFWEQDVQVLGMDYISSLCELQCDQSITFLRKEGKVTDLKKWL